MKSHAGRIRYVAFLLLFAFVLLSVTRCHSPTKSAKTDFLHSIDTATTYLNLNDTVKYVGIHTCMLCHQNIYNSFIHTGMGESFDIATKRKSSARFGKKEIVYDSVKDFYYHPFWKKDSLYILEYRMNGNDTIYKHEQQVNYIIGSGQHTNSHIFSVNGYLFQAPVTFYTQERRWDLAPGFSDGFNTRFSREVGLECMSCHNSYPDFVKGSINKYVSLPSGIACERCHGPGEVHVLAKQLGLIIDTSRRIDYTIVNPKKLSLELQGEICQRCHLQGNAVLKKGKSFFDFKPGMKLSDVMDVFMPQYEGMNNEYIMASHVARLKMSKCYPAGLNCITCHNPHIDVRSVSVNSFNAICTNCHGLSKSATCTENPKIRQDSGDNCTGCHMPKGHTLDIPHVITTDHYIRIPVKDELKNKVKRFITLYDVNNPSPSQEIKGKAFIQQYVRFQSDYPALLDSALCYFNMKTQEDMRKNFSPLIEIYFHKNEFRKILEIVNTLQINEVLNRILLHSDYSNADAWTAYYIGEAYFHTQETDTASLFFQKAVQLAPFELEFRNKLGVTQVMLKDVEKAKETYTYILTQNPQFVSGLTNMGYLALMEGNAVAARQYYEKALASDPDDRQALINMSCLFIYLKDYGEAEKYIILAVKKYPDDEQVNNVHDRIIKSIYHKVL